jgi:hypothetical protein
VGAVERLLAAEAEEAEADEYLTKRLYYVWETLFDRESELPLGEEEYWARSERSDEDLPIAPPELLP